MAAIDNVAPTLDSQVVENDNPNALVLTFSEAVTITTAGWSIDTDGAALSITGVSGSGTSAPEFTLSRDLTEGEAVTISYDSATGDTVDLSDNELADITDRAVTNNVGGVFTDAAYYSEIPVSLNGSQTITVSPSLGSLGSRTFAAKFDATDMAMGTIQVICGNDSYIQVNGSGLIRWRINAGGVVLVDGLSFPDGAATDVKVAGSYNNATGAIILNVNGNIYTGTANTGGTDSNPVTFGNYYSGGFGLVGTMKKQAVWAIAKNSSELTDIINAL